MSRRRNLSEQGIRNLLEQSDKDFEESEISGSDKDRVEMDSVVENVQSDLEGEDDEVSSLKTSFSQCQLLNPVPVPSSSSATSNVSKLTISKTKYCTRSTSYSIDQRT